MSPRSVCVEAEHDVDAHPCSQRPQGKASWNHVPDRAGIPYDFQYPTSGGQHGRSGPIPPYGTSSGWWVVLP